LTARAAPASQPAEKLDGAFSPSFGLGFEGFSYKCLSCGKIIESKNEDTQENASQSSADSTGKNNH
jgi:hypothetical protein